jgi:hypothetical protein
MERGEKTRKISAGTIPFRTMTGDGVGRIVGQTEWVVVLICEQLGDATVYAVLECRIIFV